MNLTIEAPAGSTNHGNPKLLCVPPKAIDYLIFYVANYFAQAASVVIEPGQSLPTIISCVFMALLMPGSGVARALTVIVRCANWQQKNDGQRAARAGALCMVVKKTKNQSPALEGLVGLPGEFGDLNISKGPNDPENEPQPRGTSQTENDEGNYEQGLKIPEGYSYMPVLSGTSIHGHRNLSKEFHREFYIGMVPAFANLQLTPAENVGGSSGSQTPKPLIASSISLVRPFMSLIQAVWGAITLYRARGIQVEEYGYAAFGLTVAPYVMMSVLNALGNILTPVYPCLFLIRTKLLEEVQRQGIATFDGVVNAKFDTTETMESSICLRRPRGFIAAFDNSLIPPGDTISRHIIFTTSDLKFLGICLLFGLVPLAVTGSISGFQNGNSTALERGFTMSWLVMGLFHGLLMSLHVIRVTNAKNIEDVTFGRFIIDSFLTPWLLFEFGVPAIGGMVMVGKMIKNFGICTLIS
ncbi:uncharacterized protein FPRN_13987 [Fusarium proliferatum]|nr:uncharacterized protein FPRN_13987 [Fusarium proliferatum]